MLPQFFKVMIASTKQEAFNLRPLWTLSVPTGLKVIAN